MSEFTHFCRGMLVGIGLTVPSWIYFDLSRIEGFLLAIVLALSFGALYVLAKVKNT